MSVLPACTDEMIYDGDNGGFASTDAVVFSAQVQPSIDVTTRSSAPEYDPLELQGSGDDFALYLHTWEHPLDEQYGSSSYEGETRGLQVNSAKDLSEIHGNFGVKADMAADRSPYIAMQNTRMVSTGDYSVWTTDRSNRWPGTDKLSFNAVAPYNHISQLENPVYSANSTSFTYSAIKGNGTNDAEKQVDLMTAVATMGREDTKSSNYRVPMRFHHALSAVKFAVRDVVKGKIVSISIKGVNGKGDCVFTADNDGKNGKFEWKNQSNLQTYTQVFNHEIGDGNFDPTDASADVLLTEAMPEKTFMLVPQVIPDNAEVEIEVERYNVAPGLQSKIKVKGKIKANDLKEWKAGYEYVYTVSTSKDNWVYVFDAQGNAADGRNNIYVYSPSHDKFDDFGNKADYSVKSYRYKANNQNHIEALPWKASHGGSNSYTTNGNTDTAYPESDPSKRFVTAAQWITELSDTPLKGLGTSTKDELETRYLEFLPHYVTTNWKGDEIMQVRSHYTGYSKNNPYDLSTFGEAKSKRNTANSYVIDRGGWYAFPLVYGNAVVDGGDNPSSYTSQCDDTDKDIKSTLLDYKGSKITGSYITAPAGAKAELIWEDAYNMITTPELVTIGGEKMIRFYVRSEDLQQGNAIIALTESNGTVIWSWHIWATEHWLDETTRKPHVYDQGNSSFKTFKANSVTGMRERGDVTVSYNQKGRKFKMAPYNIGWCDPKSVTYLKRKNQMDYVQYMPDGVTPTGKNKSLPIIQQGAVVDYKYGNNTYYQWGRKDPMRGYYNHEHDMKRVFGTRLPAIEPQVDMSIGKAIQNPNVFYGKIGTSGSQYEDWLPGNGVTNLWNNDAVLGYDAVDNDENRADLWSHTKTVYDPSPAGYMIPNAGVWHMLHNRSDVKWAGGVFTLDKFKQVINGAYIDNYNYKIWGDGNKNKDNALFFSSTGNRWWSDDYKVNGIGAGQNFGRNVSYAWSNRCYKGNNAYGMALGLDTDNEDSAGKLEYYVGGQFIGRRAIGRPARVIREPRIATTD